ncbi:GlpM family protein [Shinella sp.]|uniref:GlpM family protein n=1 Tax=Shinella sp. TaxID=1870904 RepID=UPI003F6F5395
MDILWKSLLGGAMTAVIALAAKRGNTLPGILPLFPLFGFISLMIIGAKDDIDAFRETCLASAKTLPAYLAFVTACYVGIGVFTATLTVLLGILVWAIAASTIFKYFQ